MAKNINDVLNDFLIQQGLENELFAKYDENSDSYYQEYTYDIDIPDVKVSGVSLIVLGGLSDKKADELFMEYCGELGLKVPVSVEAMSFLHEVGHHMTLDFLDEDEHFISKIVKIKLYGREEDTDEVFMEYFKCPEEYEATMDAVNFCNACPDVAIKLSKDIQEALYGGN